MYRGLYENFWEISSISEKVLMDKTKSITVKSLYILNIYRVFIIGMRGSSWQGGLVYIYSYSGGEGINRFISKMFTNTLILKY